MTAQEMQHRAQEHRRQERATVERADVEHLLREREAAVATMHERFSWSSDGLALLAKEEGAA